MAVIVYGPGYVRSTQGILKISEVVICFVGFLLVIIKGWAEPLQDAYIVGTIVGMAISLILIIFHITKLAKAIEGVLSFQLYFHLIWFIYLLVVSAVLLSRNYSDKFMAGGAFGIIAAVLYLVDAIDCYRIDPTPLFCFKG